MPFDCTESTPSKYADLLLKEPRCVFAHIPKTAGNSIRNVVFNGEYEGPWFGDELPQDWQSLFRFGFVRNPFDRLVSAWKMFCVGTEDDAWHLPEGGPLELSLEAVLRIGLDDEAPFGHPRYNSIKPDAYVRLKNHILPQTHPYHGLQHVQFVGRFEELDKDFAKVATKLGLPSNALPKTNWTRHAHYTEYFDDTCRELAYELYQDDLRELGYQY